MLNPEAPRLLVGRGKGQRIAFGVGEEGGVEVRAQSPRFAKLHPLGEVPGFQLVPVGPFSVLEDGVAGVEVQLLLAGAQLEHHVQVGHQLLRGAGPAGVVPGGLDAPGEGLGGVGVEPPHVVPLPAVEGHGDGAQRLDGPVRVHPQGGVFGFCLVVTHMDSSRFKVKGLLFLSVERKRSKKKDF